MFRGANNQAQSKIVSFLTLIPDLKFTEMAPARADVSAALRSIQLFRRWTDRFAKGHFQKELGLTWEGAQVEVRSDSRVAVCLRFPEAWGEAAGRRVRLGAVLAAVDEASTWAFHAFDRHGGREI